MHYFVEIAGWIAMALILLAYWLLSTERVNSRSAFYQIINILGAAGFILNSGWNGALPSAALNVAWMGIGFYALWRNRQHPRPS